MRLLFSLVILAIWVTAFRDEPQNFSFACGFCGKAQSGQGMRCYQNSLVFLDQCNDDCSKCAVANHFPYDTAVVMNGHTYKASKPSSCQQIAFLRYDNVTLCNDKDSLPKYRDSLRSTTCRSGVRFICSGAGDVTMLDCATNSSLAGNCRIIDDMPVLAECLGFGSCVDVTVLA